MLDAEERFYRELDRRYAADKRRIRFAQITDATSPRSYTIQFPDGTDPIPGVPCIARPVPQIDDWVRLELVDDDPCILALMSAPQDPQEVSTAASVPTTSATYVALTGNPQVSLSLVIGQCALVTVYARISNNPGGSGHQSFMSFATSGAEVIAAVDANAIESQSTLAEAGSKTTKVVATANGVRTWQAQYKTTTGDTATFVNRRITAVPL